MLTPLDIQNKTFSKSFKGYKDIEVDEFLDRVISDYENLFKENVELKDRVTNLSDKIEHYSSIEGTLQKTLIMAQTSAEEVVKSARDKAEMIVKDAEKEHNKKIDEANLELRKIREEYEGLKKEMMIYKSKCRTIISSQLRMMEEEFNDLDSYKAEQYNRLSETKRVEEMIAVESEDIKDEKELEIKGQKLEDISKAEEEVKLNTEN